MMGNLVKDVWQWLKNNAAPVAVVITIIPATMGGGCAVGEDYPDVAKFRNNLGMAWQAKGEYDKAIEYYELALASDLKTLGEDHPDVARVRNNLGLA
ncbi:MAG TPA: tetratricopeptide repeat protein, partial [Rhodospirillales bacterium]|nr:tetratricopeptide repeat protein [Rhodospirillales bacterium]